MLPSLVTRTYPQAPSRPQGPFEEVRRDCAGGIRASSSASPCGHHAGAGRVPEWRPTCLRAVLEGHAPNGLVCTVSHNQVIAANLDDQLGADGRAGIEPLIAELKGAFGIGKV